MKVINLVMRHERCHQMTKVGKLLKSNYTQLKFPPFLIFHLFIYLLVHFILLFCVKHSILFMENKFQIILDDIMKSQNILKKKNKTSAYKKLLKLNINRKCVIHRQQCANEDLQMTSGCNTNHINNTTRSKNQILRFIFPVINFFLYL